VRIYLIGDLRMQHDVLIIGSGPTGLMAALLLNQCGIKCRILDKNDQQAHESRAFALHARSLELLQNIGLVDKFLERGMLALGMQIFINGRKAAEMNLNDIGTTDSPYAFILMLPQSEIEKILVTELEKRGIQVEHHMEVTTFTQSDNHVLVTAIDQQGQTQQIQAAYLIGADGAHSVVRNTLGLTFAGAAYPQNFMLADCSIDWPLDYAFAKVFMRGTSLGVYLPLQGKALGRIIAANPYVEHEDSAAAKLATTAEPLSLAEIEKVFQDAAGLPVKFSNPVWTARYRIHHRGANKYGDGRVFVAGDAAHIHSPAGGQGMNTGLQDAANLIWKLALAIKGRDSKKLLDTYNAERWPVGQKLLRFTDNLFGKLSSQNKWTAALRNLFVPLIIKTITKIPRCKTRAFHFVSQLGIRYHDNAFLLDDVSPQARVSKKLSAGRRAPNALFKRNHDVFSLLTGYQFHVLALSKQALSKEEIDRIAADLALLPKDIGLPVHTHFIAHSLTGAHEKIIQAESNQVFENYGLTDPNPFGLFLIRPDGYIVYRSDRLDTKNLKQFCALFSS
jgi:2-polyprenyl-6-methoxyphenol hydroxylase-like FAD-dependent oxidoreductase